jgi:hypothetical protein
MAQTWLQAVQAQAGDLAEEVAFTDTCAVVSPTYTTGDYGTGAPTFAAPATYPTPCTWGPLSSKAAKEYQLAGQTKEVAQYQVGVPNGTTVKPQSRVYVAASGSEPLRVFEVKGIVREPQGPINLLCTMEE